MPENVDWKSIEDAVVQLATANIAEFAAAHTDETFYGFAFDCNADYGRAMPCLNTPEFHEVAIDNKHLSPETLAGYEESYGDSKPAAKPREERAKRIRWSLGDWKYQDFSNRAFEDGWAPFEQQFIEATTPDLDDFEDDDAFDKYIETVKEEFLRTVCRALIQLERAGAFNCINRTDDFRTCVIDHDESEGDGWQRLQSVRQGA